MHDRSKKLIVGSVVLVAFAAGMVLGRFVQSPTDATAEEEPAEATTLTALVEERVLESTVVTRGDASFTGTADVAPQVAGLTVPPIVTGKLPEVSDEITEGQSMLDIVGRPVIALEGELPMYRTLRPGVSGPDVKQLEEALDRLGFDPGTVNKNYTAATARAVRELYDFVGYDPPEADEEALANAEMADLEVDGRQDEVSAAEAALTQASQGPAKSEKLAAQQGVDAAQRALDDAKKSGESNAVADARDQLELAVLSRDELLKPPDTSAEQSMLDDARERLAEAQVARDDAHVAADTPLPAAEVFILRNLPRRVDDVAVTRGDEVSGVVMTVSGADLVIVANVDESVREQLVEEMPVLIDVPAGNQVEGTISDIAAAEGADASGYTLTITPPELDAEQVESMSGANLRLTIPITSTGGEVLAVPLAALTAGPGGESRVEVMAEDGTRRLVEVDVGLTAEGYAEVALLEGGESQALAPGTEIVVGD